MREKKLMMDDYMLDRVSDKIKEIIGIKKNLENVVILITCVIKDNDKFYLQLFSEEAFYDG